MIFPKRQYPALSPALDKSNLAALLSAPKANDLFCSRDRAILELLYGVGLRAHEVAGLKVKDINFAQEYMRVLGKGKRERLIPIGRHAIAAVKDYLTDLRPKLASAYSGDFLLLSKSGHPLSRITVWRIFKSYARRAGLPDSVVVHDMRRAYATHLLEGGCDLASLQRLLGHADLSTTQRYLFVSIDQLKSTCKRCHPAF